MPVTEQEKQEKLVNCLLSLEYQLETYRKSNRIGRYSFTPELHDELVDPRLLKLVGKTPEQGFRSLKSQVTNLIISTNNGDGLNVFTVYKIEAGKRKRQEFARSLFGIGSATIYQYLRHNCRDAYVYFE